MGDVATIPLFFFWHPGETRDKDGFTGQADCADDTDASLVEVGGLRQIGFGSA